MHCGVGAGERAVGESSENVGKGCLYLLPIPVLGLVDQLFKNVVDVGFYSG